MTKSKLPLLVLLFMIGTISAANAQTARLQLIHNAADPAAAVVDIYLGDTLLQPDFAFRTATPFIDAPANEDIVIGVAPGNSTSSADAIATFTFNLTEGEKYIAVANGVLDPGSFAANPDGISTAFDIYVKTMAQEAAMTSGNVEFAVMHGSTDAPTVDVVARGVATLVENAPYGAITDYLSVPAADYTIDIKDATGTVTVASFSAPLSGLADGAAFVLASGFLDPSLNQNGEAFALLGVLPDGTEILFSSVPTSVEDGEIIVPTKFNLGQNYPNPFNPSTTISFSLPSSEFVTLSVFNTLGQQVATLVEQRMNAGQHKITFDASDLVSGLYYYKIEAGSYEATKMFVLMK